MTNNPVSNLLILTFLLALLVAPTAYAQKGQCRMGAEEFCPALGLGNITSKDICEDACRACEGGSFGCGDFKTNTVNGTDYYQCQCAQTGCSGDRRSFCEDDLFGSFAFILAPTMTMVGVVTASATMAILMTN